MKKNFLMTALILSSALPARAEDQPPVPTFKPLNVPSAQAPSQIISVKPKPKPSQHRESITKPELKPQKKPVEGKLPVPPSVATPATPSSSVIPPPTELTPASVDKAADKAAEMTKPVSRDPAVYAADVCKLMEESAVANDLSLDFLTRLIWRESYFNDKATSPVGAQGIAQFMPSTAKIRGLSDPYDYGQAIPAAASYLAFLKGKFGNLGLAATAYNMGEDGTSRWLEEKRLLPYETEDYVLAITGRAADDWKEKNADFTIPSIGPKDSYQSTCLKIVNRELSPMVTIVDRTPIKPWGVMIAGGFSQSRTLATFARVKARYANLLQDELPMVVRKRNLSRGSKRLVTVMIGRNSRGEAQDLCQRLQKAGAACIVVKNYKTR